MLWFLDCQALYIFGMIKFLEETGIDIAEAASYVKKNQSLEYMKQWFYK